MTTANTTYLIEVGGIPVQVTRKAVRNVNLRIHDDGTVHMSVPWRVSRTQAKSIANERISWIRERRQEVLARHAGNEHLWQTGETIELWGKPTPIHVVPDQAEGVHLAEGELQLHVHGGLEGNDPASVAHRADMVETYLTRQMREAVQRLLPDVEGRVGQRARGITLRRMKTRWGSCTTTKGTIRLNVALAERPIECLEMVMVHELCHLYEPNHGPHFHALMDRFSPGWRIWQRYLDEHPPRV